MNKKNYVYRGILQPRCTLDGQQLALQPSLNIKSHSPDGFAWGYGGSGPSQLALAIMLIETGHDPKMALKYYQEFKIEVIAKLNCDSGWILQSANVQAWLKEKMHEEKLRLPPKPYVQGEVTPHDCYQRALTLNELAQKEDKCHPVSMDNLRSNMHLMRGQEFVAWFIEQFGHIPKRKE